MSQSARRKKLQQTTLLIPAPPVRNPLVILGLKQRAGKHEVSKSTERRKAARAARVEAEITVRNSR